MDPSQFARLLLVLGEALTVAAAKAALDSQTSAPRLGALPLADGLTSSGEPFSGVATATWLTPEQAAALLGVSPRWIARRWRRLDFVHPLPAGRGYRINAAELEATMRRRG